MSRRKRRALSSVGLGLRPSLTSLATTKASTGDFAQPEPSAGGVGRTGAMNDQCSSYFAPSAIQRRSSAISAGFTDLCDSGGGITSSGSWFSSRAMSEDFSGDPLDDDDVTALRRREGELRAIEAQAGLAGARVGTVAMVAILREDGLDVPIEGHAISGHGGQRGEREQGETRRHGRGVRPIWPTPGSMQPCPSKNPSNEGSWRGYKAVYLTGE